MSLLPWGSPPAASRRHALGALLAGTAVLAAACGSADGVAAPPSPAAATIDWSETDYTLTCDGIVPTGLHVPVDGGQARVPADDSRPPYYAWYDVRVLDTADGDLDGDGAPDTVVLLSCSPQPSNGVLQEVQVFAATGALLGALPSPRTLRERGMLPPEYDPGGLLVEDGDIVAAMHAYGPGDVHATGPSVPLTVRWRYAGGHFERVTS